MFSGNAVIYDSNQEDNFLGLGDSSVVSSILPVTLENTTLSDIHTLVFTDKPIYLTFYSFENETLRLSYQDGTGTVDNNLNIPALTPYYVRFIPSYAGENVLVTLSNISGQINYEMTFFNNDNRGSDAMNTVFTPLISGVVDLITINISIWKILYYVFILLLVISSIGAVVLLGMKYYAWTNSHNIWKHNNSRK